MTRIWVHETQDDGHWADDGRPAMFDLVAYLERQVEWSTRTFGPGDRTAGVLDHIRKELDEVAAAPGDLEEWIDLAILAFDGAWRNGHSPEAVAAALEAKQVKNAARKWPDWRTAEPGKAIEHVKEGTMKDVGYLASPWWAEGARIRVGDECSNLTVEHQDALVASVTAALTAEHIVKLHNQYLEARQMHGNEETRGKETSA